MTDKNQNQSVTMRQMFEAGVHFGHKVRYWNPKMEPYIFGKLGGSHIINLEYSLPMLNEVLSFVGKLVANGQQILFVGTKPAARDAVKKYASECSMPYVNHRWLGGMLTNFKTIKNSLNSLEGTEALLASKRINQYTKKQRLYIEHDYEKLNKNLSGIKNLNNKPAALFIIDIGHESIAVKEAKTLNIPVIAVVDTNHNPDVVDLMIPGNDDSHKAINLYLKALSSCIIDARRVAGLLDGDNKVGLTKKDAIKKIKAQPQPQENQNAEEKVEAVKEDSVQPKKAKNSAKESEKKTDSKQEVKAES